MLRAPSSRPGMVHRSSNAIAVNHQPHHDQAEINLENSVDNDDDSGYKLCSGDAKKIVELQPQHVRRLQRGLSRSTKKLLRDPSPQRRARKFTSYSSRAAFQGARSESIKVIELSSERTANILKIARRNTAELDDVIRAFAKKREPTQPNEIGQTRKNWISNGNPDEASSSSSDGSYSREGRPATLTGLSRQALSDLWQTRRDSEAVAKPLPGSLAKGRDVDLEYALYENQYRADGKSVERDNSFRSTSGLAESVAAAKSAGRKARNRQSLTSNVSYARRHCVKTIRELWGKKKSVEQGSTDGIGEQATDSDCTVADFGVFGVRKGSGEKGTTKSKRKSENTERMTNPVNPGAFDSKSTAPLMAETTAVANVAPVEQLTGDDKPLRITTLEGYAGYAPALETNPEILSLTAASAKIRELRGFDCDTGDIATEVNLAESFVFRLHPKLSDAQRKITAASNRGELLLDGPLVNGRERTQRMSHIIDPLDMVIFLVTSDADKTAKLLLNALDDAVSSISSNSTLCLHPSSVYNVGDDYPVILSDQKYYS